MLTTQFASSASRLAPRASRLAPRASRLAPRASRLAPPAAGRARSVVRVLLPAQARQARVDALVEELDDLADGLEAGLAGQGLLEVHAKGVLQVHRHLGDVEGVLGDLGDQGLVLVVEVVVIARVGEVVQLGAQDLDDFVADALAVHGCCYRVGGGAGGLSR